MHTGCAGEAGEAGESGEAGECADEGAEACALLRGVYGAGEAIELGAAREALEALEVRVTDTVSAEGLALRETTGDDGVM